MKFSQSEVEATIELNVDLARLVLTDIQVSLGGRTMLVGVRNEMPKQIDEVIGYLQRAKYILTTKFTEEAAFIE